MNRLMVRRSLAVATTAALLAGSVLATTAGADTSPPPGDPANPPTVTATALPTVQMNGVAWSQAIIGNTVYVGGQFTAARPAGAAPNSPNQTPRANLLAYDIRTGNLITTWAPSTDGQVYIVKASPDGSRIYVGGDFTTVNGVTQRRIAALNPTTGALISGFNPNPNSRVRAIAATETTVYLGGAFSTVSSVARARAAAVRASDGALLPWAPQASMAVWALGVSPDRTKVLLGGQFTTLNGQGNPGRGMGAVDAVTGASLPWPANTVIRDAGENGAINSIESDGNDVYVSGWTLGRAGGTLEGVAKLSWADGTIGWIADCHGDTYGVSPQPDLVYFVSHAHYCGNLPGGFPQADMNYAFRANALSKVTTGTLRTEYLGYTNFAGQPSPNVTHWYPFLQPGTYTGQSQAAWTIVGNGDYMALGGEFPRAGALANQHGLVRFAKKGVSGSQNTTGGEASGMGAPVVTSPGPGEALVVWPATWDRDNDRLTYRVIRNGAAVGQARTVRSADWSRPHLSYRDTGLTPGSTVGYRIFATDPDGNEVRSATASVTIRSTGTATDAYARTVLDDGPRHYWRMDEPSGTTVADFTGVNGATTNNGPTRGVAGVIPGNAATSFNGSSTQSAANLTSRLGPIADYSVEAWFRTNNNQGGKIVGFGNVRTGSSATNRFDRHIYMDNSGRISFGARQRGGVVVTSPGSYNNNQWHHVVATVADGGTELYIDGQRVAGRNDLNTGGTYVGYWRIGGDTLAGWPNQHTNDYFTGSIDEVAVYTTALTPAQVRNHYNVATGAPPVNQSPTAGFTSSASGLTVSFTSTSTDPDGTISSYAWTFGDGTTSTAQNPVKTFASANTYNVTLRVTDNAGATATVTQPVTVSPGTATPTALAADGFSRTVSNGWGSADTGGAWATSTTANLYSTAGGSGLIRMNAAGSGPRVTLGSFGQVNTDATVRFGTDKAPTGAGTYLTLQSRANANGSSGYRATTKVTADGRVSLVLSAAVAGVETKLASVLLPATTTYQVGDTLQVRLQATGTSPTTLRMRVWKVGTAEPSTWQITTTDSRSELQAAGGVGVMAYLSGTATNAPVVARFDDLAVVRVD